MDPNPRILSTVTTPADDETGILVVLSLEKLRDSYEELGGRSGVDPAVL
jgi:hypothetical protein